MSLYILPPSQNKSIPIIINYSERYTPRVLAAQLDDVRSRFGTKCTSMLRLQEMERDSTFQLQRMEWAQRAQEWVHSKKRVQILIDTIIV